jgi:hypothetical protein
MYIIFDNIRRDFMIQPSKFLLFVIFQLCFIWQNAYSQLLYIDNSKEEYLPPYDPNVVVISPEVEKWMNEQIANKDSSKKTVKMKTDVMGRVKSSSNGIGQEKVVESKQKRLVMIVDMHIREHEIESEYGRYEYNMETKKFDYFLNDKKMSEKEYIEYLDKSLEKFKQQKRGKRDLPIPGVVAGADDRSWVALMTAEEISELARNYKELAIVDYTEPKGLASQASILSSTQLSTYAFPSGYGGNGIGVYVTEVDGAMLGDITNSSKYTAGNYLPAPGSVGEDDRAHHTMVANIVQMASPLAHVVGFKMPVPGNQIMNPTNPFSYSPPLEIGSHSYYFRNESTFYGAYDLLMDCYIYENKIINFVAAGNDKNTIVTSPGKAMNVITVGAINPATKNYANYSSWKNPILLNRVNLEQMKGHDKPEIAMYTDIEFPNNDVYQAYYSYPYNNGNGFDGTSAATPLAAGFTATLLEKYPFFKRQPALTKAALLAGETIPIQNANSWDTDNYNSKVARGIVNYSSIAGTRSRWWSGGNSAHFSSKQITFTENNIQANKRYRIAIAWLVNGSYVYNNGKPPQNIDLYVVQNNMTIASSTSPTNPFEIVDFVTTSNAPLTILIYRPSNSGSNNVLLGYYMRENF